jgi:hypothetical protein
MGKPAVLMATAFVGMIGAVMILPLIPFYAETLGAVGLMRVIVAPTRSGETGSSPTPVGVAPGDAAPQTLPAVE